MSANNILIVSEQAPGLQQIIQTGNLRASIDVGHHDLSMSMPLFPEKYRLLIIDFSLLINPQAFFDQLDTILPRPATLLLVHNQQRSQAIAYLMHDNTDYLLCPFENRELMLKVERMLTIQALKSSAKPDTANELLALLEASQEINHTLQLDEVLRLILFRAKLLTTPNLAMIFLADRAEHLNRYKTVSLEPNQPSNKIDFLFELAQQVAQYRQIICRRKNQEPGWDNPTLHSALLIPLVSREKLIGVLALGSNQEAAFANNQIDWLSIFCDRAAVALENANLFQDLSSAYIDLAQSRETILQSRNTLQALFEGITDDLYIVDQTLTITALNQVSSDQHEHQPNDLVGQSYLALDWVQLAPELLKYIREVFETSQEKTWMPPEEETQPYLKDREFRIYPVRNRLGLVEQAIIFAQDVSERRRWQASLFRSANLAAVGQLAGSVAHQINNPLTVAMANSQLILLEAGPHKEIYELATDIFKSTERIQRIVRNLLEFSNQESYFFVETDLIATIDDALSLVMRSLKKINAQVIKDYQARPRLSASVSHLKLVWMNLLLNAHDAIINHPGQPQITISTQMLSEREVKVLVTDNGVGIVKENLSQIYQPFFTTKPVGKALGLGLYSAHTILEHHHGTINAYSKPGIKTTFEITLPLDNPRDL
jgi:two-component system NtrC family sensor kinase